MTDQNCQAAIGWYRACAALADSLNGPERDQYTTALIENVKYTSDDYFGNSYRPLSTLSVIQDELGHIVESLLYPPHYTKTSKFKETFLRNDSIYQKKIQSKSEGGCKSEGSTCWIDQDMLMKAIGLAGALALILTVVILCIMLLYCLQYRKMKKKKKEIEFATECGVTLCQGGQCQCKKKRDHKKSRGDESEESEGVGESENDVGIRFTAIRIAPQVPESEYSLPPKKTDSRSHKEPKKTKR